MPGISPLKLFISHSSKTEKHLQLLKDVCQALGQHGAGFHVLVDENGEIPVGEEWFCYLAEWMAECDAAIILFSEEAFHESQWVRAEAAILSWRKRIQPNFKLFAILLDGVDPNDYAQDQFFNVIRFADFQHVRDCRSDKQTEIVQKIKDALGDAQTVETPFQDLITKISDILSKVDRKVLERTYKRLDNSHKPLWQSNLDYSDALARLMLRDPHSALSQLKFVLKELAHIPNFKSGAETLLEMLKGMWVKSDAAAVMACCIKQPFKIYLLNGQEVQDFSGPSYLRRAWAHPNPYKIIAAGSSRTEVEIKETLLSAFPNLNSRMAERRLKAYKDPLVLLFSAPESNMHCHESYPDHDLLKQIQQNFPNVMILIATGEQIPEELKSFATPIEPLLESGEEDQQYIYFDEVKELIETQIMD